MDYFPIDNSDVPIRLFKSNFLEFFTHISPVVVDLIWLPIALFFLLQAILQAPASPFPLYIPLGFLLGLFLWTLAEYLLHRFLFHMKVKGERAKHIIFLFHGIHHAQPQIKTRLVMPPVVSIPMAAIFYGLFTLVFAVLLHATQWVFPLFSGFILGYLVYDNTHYAQHHFPMRRGYFKYIKRYHMQHHYKTPEKRFGVSSPLWDFVFKTYPG